jgi:hypothetical protein
VGRVPDLDLEPTAPYTPHIVYFDNVPNTVKHSWLTAGGWLSETIPGDESGLDPSIAFSPIEPYTCHVTDLANSDSNLRHSWLVPGYRVYLPLVLRGWPPPEEPE